MDDIQPDTVKQKLERCFALVFPNLDPARYATASAQNLSEWDSIAQLNLLGLIGEEFGREIDFEDFEGATSFAGLERTLRSQETGEVR